MKETSFDSLYDIFLHLIKDLHLHRRGDDATTRQAWEDAGIFVLMDRVNELIDKSRYKLNRYTGDISTGKVYEVLPETTLIDPVFESEQCIRKEIGL